MKKIIESILITLWVYVAFYIIVAFIYAESDFRLWEKGARAAVALFSPVFSAFLIGLHYLKK